MSPATLTPGAAVGEDGLDRPLAEVEGAVFDPVPMVEIYAEIFEAAASSGPTGLLYVLPAALSILLLIAKGAPPPWRTGERRRARALVDLGGDVGTTTSGGAPRRILMTINLLFRAGAETQLRNLAIGLSRQGHDVTLLAVEDVVAFRDELEAAGVRLEVLGARSRRQKLRALPALVRAARRADLVHCTGWDASLWGRLAAIAARRPVVVSEHAGDRNLQVSRGGVPRARLIALHNRLLDRATNATVVVSTAQRPVLESEGVRPGSIVLIPNGVPIEELRRRADAGEARDSLGIPAAAAVVLHVARFASPKRQETTLRAVARLRERFGDVRVVFAGDGDTEAEVRREAARLGAEWASFLGSRDDVPALLRAADLAVLPSSAEGLPMSLIEAMAVGTPVVATDVGDVRRLLETTGGGLCVPAGDDEAFVAACGRVLGDAGLRERLRQAGLAGAADFDSARMVQRYGDLFEVAIASRLRVGAAEPVPAA
jgi:glycosyltransferase involved in cell wall biosynthesis